VSDTIEVLNGTVTVGDKVAIAVNGGMGGSMRIGTVVEVRERSLRIRVEQTSGGHWGPLPYVKTFPYPKAAVKL